MDKGSRRRVLERPGRGKWLDWGLEDLEIGDELIVPHDVLKFPRVYEYVKKRQYQLDRFFVVERGEHSSVVRRTVDEQPSGRRAVTRPGHPGQPVDWGVIRKPVGQKRWNWPFGHMEIGDVFWVAHEDIQASQLQHRKDQASYQLQQKFRLTTDNPEHPGFFKVQRVLESVPGFTANSMGLVALRVDACYRSDNPEHKKQFFDEIDFGNLEDWYGLEQGGKRVAFMRQIAKPPRSSYVFDAPAHDGPGRFGVMLYKDRVEIERIDPEMTLEQYDELQLARTLAIFE